MRLDRYMADMSIGTRKEIGMMIRKGRVTVNGTTAKDAAMQVSPDTPVFVDGTPIPYEEWTYLIMNKPCGVISATEDPRQKTVLDLLPKIRRKDLFPVGRLDIDTTGLLLITNDGALSHRLLSPKRHVDKTYEVMLEKPVGSGDPAAFAAGLVIPKDADGDGFTALPAKLVEGDSPKHVFVTIREGKYHQVKRMFAARGNKVLSLKRLTMGSLSLDPELHEGEVRRLTDAEVQALKEETL
jgi:16S rRNA pseudouridine516 synthase